MVLPDLTSTLAEAETLDSKIQSDVIIISPELGTVHGGVPNF